MALTHAPPHAPPHALPLIPPSVPPPSMPPLPSLPAFPPIAPLFYSYQTRRHHEPSEVRSGFALVMVLLAFGSTLLVIMVCVVLPAKFRVYARRRYEAGQTSMCCGCIRLRGMEQQESAPRCWSCEGGSMSVTCSRTSGLRLYWLIALPQRSAEDIWVAAQIEALPAHSWSRQGDAECSLCMEPFSVGELVRTLPCEHGFHDKCIKPWLLEGQKGRRERNCPLCRTAVAFRERDVEPVAQNIEVTSESVV